jgi:hypothetical protein
MANKNYKNTFGAGDGNITPARANMNQMAKGGGLSGFMDGGGTYDGLMKAQDGRGDLLSAPPAPAWQQQQQSSFVPPPTSAPTSYRKHNSRGSKDISAARFNRIKNRMNKRDGTTSLGTNTSVGQQVINKKGNRSVSRTTPSNG